MGNSSISVYGSKIFLEIITEVSLFSKYSLQYYNNLDLCIKESEKENKLIIIFLTEQNKNLCKKINNKNLPVIFVGENTNLKNIDLYEFFEKINIPFFLNDLDKKIVSLFARIEFKNNSLISLRNYIVDKNERKIKKNNIELRLSEKEISFLVLFSTSKSEVSKNLVLKKVWNYSSESETHTVETHVHRLRKKILKVFNDSNFIKNNKKGYYI
mgnify:CR=1 FL=1|jgi:DNA-binding response OmpR family regulator|tara:strand:- start:270 stop:908 length:639 start_codon:yes stop_codon:yes gene_type:complete